MERSRIQLITLNASLHEPSIRRLQQHLLTVTDDRESLPPIQQLGNVRLAQFALSHYDAGKRIRYRTNDDEQFHEAAIGFVEELKDEANSHKFGHAALHGLDIIGNYKNPQTSGVDVLVEGTMNEALRAFASGVDARASTIVHPETGQRLDPLYVASDPWVDRNARLEFNFGSPGRQNPLGEYAIQLAMAIRDWTNEEEGSVRLRDRVHLSIGPPKLASEGLSKRIKQERERIRENKPAYRNLDSA